MPRNDRGDRREAIFKDDFDRRRFLETLGEACAKTDWQVHAYSLMGNHFHLVIEMPQPNLVAGMKWFLGTYTSRFNRRHKLFGDLFSGRYKALVVGGSGTCYVRTVCKTGSEMTNDALGPAKPWSLNRSVAPHGTPCANGPISRRLAIHDQVSVVSARKRAALHAFSSVPFPPTL